MVDRINGLTPPQWKVLKEAARVGSLAVRPVDRVAKNLVAEGYATFVKRQGGGFDFVLTEKGREHELAERQRPVMAATASDGEVPKRHVGLPQHVKAAMGRSEEAKRRAIRRQNEKDRERRATIRRIPITGDTVMVKGEGGSYKAIMDGENLGRIRVTPIAGQPGVTTRWRDVHPKNVTRIDPDV